MTETDVVVGALALVVVALRSFFRAPTMLNEKLR